MKYMILIKATQQEFEEFGNWSNEATQRNYAYMNQLNDELIKSGEFVQGVGLDGPAVARTVRARTGDEPLVTDGPFGESKELLAGFWIVEVENEQRAFEIAARASAAPGKDGEPENGPIEVHPVPDANIVQAG